MNEQQQAPLTNEQLTEVLRLAKGADSVELKLTIPDAEHRSTAAALDMDLLEAQIRQVVFFDTPDLALYDRGVVVRARRVQRKGDDSVVKLRPVVPDHLSAGLRKTPGFGVEVDAMPGGFVCSASLKAALDRPHVRETLLGKGPVRRLFTKEQRAFYQGARSRRSGAGRSVGSRSAERSQAEVLADRLQATRGRGALGVPRRVPHLGALHEMPTRRGLPSGG